MHSNSSHRLDNTQSTTTREMSPIDKQQNLSEKEQMEQHGGENKNDSQPSNHQSLVTPSPNATMAQSVGNYGYFGPPGFVPYGPPLCLPTANGGYFPPPPSFVTPNTSAPPIVPMPPILPMQRRTDGNLIYEPGENDVVIGGSPKKRRSNALFIEHVRRSVSGREGYARLIHEWRKTGGDFLFPCKDKKGKPCYVLATNKEATDYARDLHFNDVPRNAARREMEEHARQIIHAALPPNQTCCAPVDLFKMVRDGEGSERSAHLDALSVGDLPAVECFGQWRTQPLQNLLYRQSLVFLAGPRFFSKERLPCSLITETVRDGALFWFSKGGSFINDRNTMATEEQVVTYSCSVLKRERQLLLEVISPRVLTNAAEKMGAVEQVSARRQGKRALEPEPESVTKRTRLGSDSLSTQDKDISDVTPDVTCDDGSQATEPATSLEAHTRTPENDSVQDIVLASADVDISKPPRQDRFSPSDVQQDARITEEEKFSCDNGGNTSSGGSDDDSSVASASESRLASRRPPSVLIGDSFRSKSDDPPDEAKAEHISTSGGDADPNKVKASTKELSGNKRRLTRNRNMRPNLLLVRLSRVSQADEYLRTANTASAEKMDQSKSNLVADADCAHAQNMETAHSREDKENDAKAADVLKEPRSEPVYLSRTHDAPSDDTLPQCNLERLKFASIQDTEEDLDVADFHAKNGLKLFKEGNYPDALCENQKSLEIRSRLVPDSMKEASAHFNVGSVLHKLGDQEGSLREHRRALAIQSRLAPDSLEAAGSHANVGFLLAQRGKSKEALEQFRSARTLLNQLEKSTTMEMCKIRIHIGALLRKLGDFSGSLFSYEKALRIVKILKLEPSREAGLHKTIGVVLQEQGKVEGAISKYRQALSIYEKIDSLRNVKALRIKIDSLSPGSLAESNVRPQQGLPALLPAREHNEPSNGRECLNPAREHNEPSNGRECLKESDLQSSERNEETEEIETRKNKRQKKLPTVTKEHPSTSQDIAPVHGRPRQLSPDWTEEEDTILREKCAIVPPLSWNEIANCLYPRTMGAVRGRFCKLGLSKRKIGRQQKGRTTKPRQVNESKDNPASEGNEWTAAEDSILRAKRVLGGLTWAETAAFLPGRTGSACSMRFRFLSKTLKAAKTKPTLSTSTSSPKNQRQTSLRVKRKHDGGDKVVPVKIAKSIPKSKNNRKAADRRQRPPVGNVSGSSTTVRIAPPQIRRHKAARRSRKSKRKRSDKPRWNEADRRLVQASYLTSFPRWNA